MTMYKYFVFVLILVYVRGTAQSSAVSPLPVSKNAFIVISHRGNHIHVPENTIASVTEAIKSGADYAEIDLRTTKDGYLVLSHDATVDRMTDGKGNVKDLTLEEIKRLKITANGVVYRIPEFKDVLAACGQRINIYLDFKDADAGEAYRQIKVAGMEKHVVVYLNKVPQYKDWRTVAPQMPLMSSIPRTIQTAAQLDAFLGQVRIEALDNVYDTALLAVTRARGIAVWLDVEGKDEDETIWRQMLGKGVQGLQTDHPDSLIAFLHRPGTPMPVGSAAVRATPATPAVAPYRPLMDVSYGPDAANTMDCYIPEDHDNARVIVYLHGGGWTGGDKKEFPTAMIDELVGRRKYILVSMNYRLVKDGKNRFPAQMQDIGEALEFIASHAGRYGYNGHDFALMGGSAGAHLALLYAYGYDSAHRIKTVVDYWGPTDLADKDVRARNPDGDRKVVNLLGVSDPLAPECLAASPYYRLTKSSGVPTILFQGGEDPQVDPSQSEKLYKKLQTLDIPTRYELYPHEKHGVGPGAAADVFQKTEEWLEKYYPSKQPPAVSSKISPVDPRPYSERLGFPKGAKVIIFHVDDAGMSVNSNEGALNSIEKGIATSTSIMMPCPWAASFAREAKEKHLDAGLHLTLTSEWHDYRWPPVAGVREVPGLVDKEGCLWPEPSDVVGHATADQVDTEIRAQLQRALALGLQPTHLDSHMGTLFANADYLERYIRLGIEYHIPVMFPGGNNKLLMAASVSSPVGSTKEIGQRLWQAGLPVLDDLVSYSGSWKPKADANGNITPRAYEKYKVEKIEEAIRNMAPGVMMLIVHSTEVTDDFRKISHSGDSRNADMLAMMDPDLKAWLQSQGVILTTWRELMERRQRASLPSAMSAATR